MRPLEIVVVTVLTLSGAVLAVPDNRKLRQLIQCLPFAAIAVVVAQFWLESFRWQAAPLYMLAVLLCLVAYRRHVNLIGERSEVSSRATSTVFNILYVVAAFVLLGGGVVLMTLLPVVHLPKPTGPYAVGTTRMTFVDQRRQETLTDDPDDVRRFEARVWYPADPTSKKNPAPYRERSASVGSLVSGPPDLVYSHLKLSRSNSFERAPIARSEVSYPVILFSAGFLAGHEDYQLITEELASHGYVVFSFTNPYESEAAVQPTGEVVPFSAKHAAGYRQHMETVLPLWEEFWASDDTTVTHEIARLIIESETFMDNLLRIRVTDAQFALDELERLNAKGSGWTFSGRLDLSRLGVVGHSMGGAVAGQICLVDPRVRAGINMDGFQFGDVLAGVVSAPFMTLYSEPFAGANEFVTGNFGDTTYSLTIAGTTHMNFSDWPVVLPITRRIGMAGAIEPARATSIANDYLRAFFDKHLGRLDSPLFQAERSKYPEVRFSIRTP